ELIGTDQWITSGPAATTAALRGRIHGCTRIVSRKVRFFFLALRAPSIHGTDETFTARYLDDRSLRQSRPVADVLGTAESDPVNDNSPFHPPNSNRRCTRSSLRRQSQPLRYFLQKKTRDLKLCRGLLRAAEDLPSRRLSPSNQLSEGRRPHLARIHLRGSHQGGDVGAATGCSFASPHCACWPG